jgi:hypothetical protein
LLHLKRMFMVDLYTRTKANIDSVFNIHNLHR